MPKDPDGFSLIQIDLKARTISVAYEDESGEIVLRAWPLTAKGGHELRYAKVSPGGHLIQSLTGFLQMEREKAEGHFGH